MAKPDLTTLVDRIVLAGVGLTTEALAAVAPGPSPELTFPQWRVLVVLGEAPAGLTVSEVAGTIGVTVPATSRQLRRLAARGMIEITPDPGDRRAARARLTSTGARTRSAVLGFRRRSIAAGLHNLGVAPSTLADLARIADALGD
jgi:DNA-binding MarR family transcriptional regulator